MEKRPDSFLNRLRLPPRLRRRDLWLTWVPMVLWLAALYGRPLFIHPYCEGPGASRCQPDRVLALDRPGIGNLSGDADFYSYALQNSVGAAAAAAPALYQATLWATGRSLPGIALAAAATDTVVFLQTWFINGLFNESARIAVGRPRPYLYPAPERGQTVDALLLTDPQNYTSFYSGHTSFVTAACVSLILTLLGRGASGGLLVFAGLFAQCLIFSTGVFRILSGRHFLTDVLTAMVMGALSALFVALSHRDRPIQ